MSTNTYSPLLAQAQMRLGRFSMNKFHCRITLLMESLLF